MTHFNNSITSLILLALLSPTAMAQMIGPPAPRDSQSPSGPAQVKELKNKVWSFLKGEPSKPAATVSPTGPNTVKPMNGAANSAPVSSTKPAETPAAHIPLLAEPEPTELKVDAPKLSKENPPRKLTTLDNPTNVLGLLEPMNRLNNISQQIDRKDFTTARVSLVPLRQWLIDATEAHINLYKTLDNVSTAQSQAELEKQLALQFAVMRDKAMFNMARIWINEHDYRDAIKDLVEVIKSQPRSELGYKAYNMLQEIGFTEKLQIAE